MSAATLPHALTPAAAWQLLASGNARFVNGTPRHPHHSMWRRRDLAAGQHPFATVVGCSDSRVSPEIAFDRGLGDVFVVRNAGHVLDDATLGSIEYGVHVAGTPLLVIMGHEACGCIAATMAAAESGEIPGGYVGSLVRQVLPSVHAASETGTTCAGEVMEEHVRQTVRGLLSRCERIASAVERGDLAIAGVTYRLSDGAVNLLDWAGNLGRPQAVTPETVNEAERAIVAQQAAATAVSAAVQTEQAADEDDSETVEAVEAVAATRD
ncbi:carbonic anhydrase [Mobilicoccus massiliensis]|uniref:carbonic anhydrase n=1 Tax=Mobilicoccus massiliensis TaxID=1522310 RepID=UPI0009E1B4AF|nr:carbonic anhydrase [Mobilicoccus massiliensis]